MYLELVTAKTEEPVTDDGFNLLWRSNVFGTRSPQNLGARSRFWVSISFGDLMYLEQGANLEGADVTGTLLECFNLLWRSNVFGTHRLNPRYWEDRLFQSPLEI